MSRLEMKFLGGLTLQQDDVPLTAIKSQKGVALLCYLAVSQKRVTRPILAALFWPDMSEDQALMNLRKVLQRLQPLRPYLLIARETVAFDQDADYWLDVAEFEGGTAASTLPSSGVPQDIPRLQKALSLYQGDFLDGFMLADAPLFDEWELAQRARLREAALTALQRLVAYFREEGEYETAVAYARQLLTIEPWHEEIHRELMRLLALSGQRSAALAQYQSCCRLLADELGVEPTATTNHLYEQIKAGEFGWGTGEQERGGDSLPPHNLPPQMTPFVGREAELATLQKLLAEPDVHLITILGPGGIGKTRLALALARQIWLNQGGYKSHPYQNGVYFASLARLESADLLLPAIAETINFRFTEADNQRGQLLRYLAGKAMLLVLDNFEHLLPSPLIPPNGGEGAFSPIGGDTGGEELVAEILRIAPQVKIVITSRVRLNRQIEQLFPIEGMAYPSVNSAAGQANSSSLGDYSAVQLFVQCARRVQPYFELTADNQAYVLDICRWLQGMPLGIVLAASWLESLSLKALISEMQQDKDFLATDMRDVPQRQRSLRAAFNYSWRLLSTRERDIFCQMSIFRGGFSRAAAQAVTGAALPDLQALVNKSLLTLTADRRYDVHELLRQYGAEKLAEEEKVGTAVRRQHSHFYCVALQRWEADLKSPRQPTAVAEMQADYQNILAAWDEALLQGQLTQLVSAVSGLGEFYDAAGRWVEGVATMQKSAERVQAVYGDIPTVAVAAQLLVWLWAWRVSLDTPDLAFYTPGERTLLLQFLEPGWDLLNQPVLAELDVRAEKAFVQLLLGRILQDLDKEKGKEYIERGQEHLAASLKLYQSLDDDFHRAEVLLEQHAFLFNEGMPEQAYLLLQESLTLFRRIGEPRKIIVALCALGHLAGALLAFAEAAHCLDEAYTIAQTVSYYWGMAEARKYAARLASRLGHFDLALTHLEEALVWAKQTNSPPLIGDCLGLMAWIQLYRGQFSQALSLNQESRELSPEKWIVNLLPLIHLHAGHYDIAELLSRTDPGTIKRLSNRTLAKLWLKLVQTSYTEALSLARQLYDELSPMGDRAWVQISLAFALFGLDRAGEAKQELYQSLQTCMKIRAFNPLMHSMPIISVVLADGADDRLKERAIELHALAESQPFVGTSQLFTDLVGKPMAAVAATLPLSSVEAAQGRGRKLDWWETAESLLSELQVLGWGEMKLEQAVVNLI